MMCQMTVLARLDYQRCVTCCQHGTIYLHWGRFSVYFDVESFKKLLETLEVAVPDVQRRDHHTGQDEAGVIELRLDELALELRPLDFMLLLSVVRSATEALAYQSFKEGDSSVFPPGASHRFHPN